MLLFFPLAKPYSKEFANEIGYTRVLKTKESTQL
jgi:hypothetical protein